MTISRRGEEGIARGFQALINVQPCAKKARAAGIVDRIGRDIGIASSILVAPPVPRFARRLGKPGEFAHVTDQYVLPGG